MKNLKNYYKLLKLKFYAYYKKACLCHLVAIHKPVNNDNTTSCRNCIHKMKLDNNMIYNNYDSSNLVKLSIKFHLNITSCVHVRGSKTTIITRCIRTVKVTDLY